jgi:hypothetical protein
LRFTVRRPDSAEVSPCCHRPSGGDVACGVHVGIARARTAGDALENRLALAVFRRDMPTGKASLRRVRSWNGFDPSRSFVVEPGNNQSPALAVNLTVEAPFLRDVGARMRDSAARRARQGPHIQIFDADDVEAARHVCGDLFQPVAAAVRFASAQPRNGAFGSCTPVRSALCPGQTLLQSSQPLSFTYARARGAQQLARGQRHRDYNPAVNTHHAAVTGPRYRVGHGSKSYVPATRSIARDAVRLHGAGDLAGPTKANPTDFRYPDLAVAAVQPFEVARLESDLPKSFMSAGLAPRRATMGAVEKVAHRVGEIPQRLLLHSLRPGGQPREFCSRRRQLRTLLVVTRRLPTRLPVPLLLYGQIPNKPGMATMLDHHCRLLNARKQSKPAHTGKIGASTDNTSRGGKRRFVPWLHPRASTPQFQ